MGSLRKGLTPAMAAWVRERRPIEELRHGVDLVIMAGRSADG